MNELPNTSNCEPDLSANEGIQITSDATFHASNGSLLPGITTAWFAFWLWVWVGTSLSGLLFGFAVGVIRLIFVIVTGAGEPVPQALFAKFLRSPGAYAIHAAEEMRLAAAQNTPFHFSISDLLMRMTVFAVFIAAWSGLFRMLS